MVSIVKVDQIQNSDGTVEYLNAGSIKNASLHSSVTGGSGINALGTVASGTLGSSVTFPAGHIIQVVSENFEATSSASSTTEVSTFLTKSITSSQTNSKFLVMVNSMTGAEDRSPRIILRRTIGGVVHNIVNDSSQDGITMLSDARLSSVRHGTNFHLSYVDSPTVSSGTSINYLIVLRGADSGTVYLGQSGYTNPSDSDIKCLSSMTIMELAA